MVLTHTYTPELNAEQHVAITRNGNNLNLYINGSFITSEVITGDVYPFDTSGFLLGVTSSAASHTIRGIRIKKAFSILGRLLSFRLTSKRGLTTHLCRVTTGAVRAMLDLTCRFLCSSFTSKRFTAKLAESLGGDQPISAWRRVGPLMMRESLSAYIGSVA